MESQNPLLPKGDAAPQDAESTIPVIEEQVDIEKHTVETGKGVRLHKTISEHDETIDVPVRREICDIRTVAIGRILDEGVTPVVRVEGSTTIVPVLEEIVVIQKRLRLKEEIHITRRAEQETETHTVTLKSENVTVEHFDEKNESSVDKPMSNPLLQKESGTASRDNDTSQG